MYPLGGTDAVRPLAESPERPRSNPVATLGRGDSLRRVRTPAWPAIANAGQWI
jgi:hypothetical protein